MRRRMIRTISVAIPAILIVTGLHVFNPNLISTTGLLTSYVIIVIIMISYYLHNPKN